MSKSYEELQQELEELYEEYNGHYEASRDIMSQIQMVESDLIKIKEDSH